jgi:hypothetical protein
MDYHLSASELSAVCHCTSPETEAFSRSYDWITSTIYLHNTGYFFGSEYSATVALEPQGSSSQKSANRSCP